MQFEMPTLFGGPSADYLIFSGVVILGTVAWVWSQRGRGVLSEARAPGAKSDGVSSAGGVVNGEGKSEGLTTENNSWVGLFRNWSNSIVSRSFRLIVTAVLKPVDFIVSVFGSVAPGRAESRNQTAVGTVARVRLAAHAAAAAPSRTAAVPGMVRAVQAAEATPLSNDVQWDKLTARIRRSIRSAHTAEGCHEAAVIPLPAALPLALTALAGLGLIGRWRRN